MRYATNGYVLYEGASEFTGQLIVVVATGFKNASRNRKTGHMIQVCILQADEHPQTAVTQRTDAAICGGCILRKNRDGKRKCYVNIMRHGFGEIYKQYKAGRYPVAADLALLGSKQRIRLGSYGDPAAVPLIIWKQLLSRATGWTGYTHGWRKRPDLMPFLQASVDSEAEYFEAATLGWGTYRIGSPDSSRLANETICPASEEGGHTETCSTCLICDGSSHVVIQPHGVGKSYFRSLPILQENL